ncbi:hypothetical protein V6N13_143696 [Hibiscus sabdariffa]|uniref:Uncharacterized protein n=1 Tax=Hibiscus sabdariffa TaxID=183260 RepID=A0ABR2FI54_9ROSI
MMDRVMLGIRSTRTNSFRLVQVVVVDDFIVGPSNLKSFPGSQCSNGPNQVPSLCVWTKWTAVRACKTNKKQYKVEMKFGNGHFLGKGSGKFLLVLLQFQPERFDIYR